MSFLQGQSPTRHQVVGRWSLRNVHVGSLLRADGWVIVVLTLSAWVLASLAIWIAPAPVCIVGEKADVGCARGFQARERDEQANRTYRWSDRTATLLLSGAGYGSAQAVDLQLAAARPPGNPLPQVEVDIGIASAAFVASVGPRRYRLLLPPGFPTGDVARLTISSDTMRMRNGRDLGVVVYAARILPLGTLTLAGPLLTLALLGLGLSGALVASASPWIVNVRRRPIYGSLAGIGWMLLFVALWLWRPERVMPLLPAWSAIVALGVLGLRRLYEREQVASLTLRRTMGVGVTLGMLGVACLANGILDWAILEGTIRRLQLPWVVVAQTLVTLLICWWLGRAARDGRFSLTLVLATALSVRLLAFAVRVLTGRVPNDGDTELFYNYGRATIELGVPEVEYPSGALAVWAALALPGSRELFLLLAPLLNLVCDLVISWGIWRIGAIAARRDTDQTAPVVASYAALCYALSPLLLPFWHTKFDPVPAALTVLALVAYAAERPWWTGVALGIGGAVKWVPWVGVPFPAWAWLRPAKLPSVGGGGRGQPRWPTLLRYAAGVIVSVAALSLPFALYDFNMFLMPYRIQGGRQFIGESIWYPIALLFEPELQARRAPPYAGLPSDYLSNGLMVGVQLLALALLGLLQVALPQRWRRTLVLTALAPAIFLLLNRVFSPQYLLIIVACMYAAAAAIFSLRQIVTLALLITVMEAANLIVWPYTQSYWLWFSIINLGIGIVIVAWLAFVALRETGRQGNKATK